MEYSRSLLLPQSLYDLDSTACTVEQNGSIPKIRTIFLLVNACYYVSN